MEVTVNGELKDLTNGIFITQMLQELKIDLGTVVVELNKEIIERELFSQTELKPGDKLEIVQFMGGG